MLLNAFLVIVFTLAFLFLIWRKLKEDYIQGQIFGAGFSFLIGASVSLIATIFILQEHWYIICILTSFIFLFAYVFKFKMNYFEVIEAFVPSFIVFNIFILVMKYLILRDLKLAALFFVNVLCLIAYYISKKYYKSFRWYPSGRIGFSGLSTISLFFILYSIVAVLPFHMISFLSKIGVFVSFAISILSTVLIIRISRK